MDKDRDSIWTLLLGREWSKLTVTSIPETGEIRLDGGDISTGRLETGFLDPGEHRLVLTAYGYGNLRETVVTAPGEIRELEFNLETLSMQRIPVRSYPQGADLFLGSKWIGKTPVFLDVPSEFSRILVRKDGWDDYSYYIEGGRTENL